MGGVLTCLTGVRQIFRPGQVFRVQVHSKRKEHGMQTRSTTVIDKPVEADETHQLISSEKVDGTSV